jgi:glycosyltransferase involved in cell wall biosynthesis
MTADPITALVAIGRNEGERLERCLASATGRYRLIVYVDSGSTDGSVQAAEAVGAEVVALDMSVPFTAARARNAGWRRAAELVPDLRFVQFVDGDCEIQTAWPALARDFLDTHPRVAAVAGLRRERFPQRSIYNLICDTEWQRPAGETTAIGGDVLMRLEALQAAGGYDDRMIAGEEPELCLRLRRLGWGIWQLDTTMTLHDADMTRFGQWWKRTMRAGYAFSLGASMHGRAPERFWVTEQRRGLLWGVGLPLLGLLAGLVVSPWAVLAVPALYALQWWRLFRRQRNHLPKAAEQTFFLVLGKFAEGIGQIKFAWHRLTGAQARLIEYK